MSLAGGPILLLGAGGMLGRAWRALLESRALPYLAVPRQELDLAGPHVAQTASDLIARHSSRLVVNCAAWTDVDAAETHEPDALAVNATGVGQLAAACQQHRALLVHYSTDYVFDGTATAPYPVDHPRNPINAYGRTKAQGEQAIQSTPGLDYLLIRTSWLYAPWGKNFVRTMARLTREKPSLRVVDDQRGRPTSAVHLAGASLLLLERDARGVYHVTDSGECTWFQFACQINRELGHACDIQPCTTQDFPRPARRPAYSVLDLSQTQALIGTMPSWRDNLRDVLQRLEHVGAA